jgi:hypothetical protein
MKIQDFNYNIDDIITTDGYLNFCKRNNICYVKTDFFYIGQFFWRGNLHPNKIETTCVVGHSDYPITDAISDKFKKVFCVNRSTKNENTFGIPLGITNDCEDSLLHKIYGNREIMIDVSHENPQKENLVYLNFNIQNFPSERQIVFDKFNSEKWVLLGKTGLTLESRIKFLRDIKSSKFVFCPRGNGIDTHRIWETLYMGSIPIVKYENAHHLFTDLPILFVNDWSEIKEKFLEQKYQEIIQKEWNLDKLKISFWEDFIKQEINQDI